MALTPEGARLTELHRLLQVRLSAQSMAATRLHWTTMNPAQGSRAMNDWLKRQVALSGVFDKQSAAAAADYVQKFRAAEGFPPGPVVGVQDYDPKWAAESMSYNGSNKVGLLMDQGVGAKEALARVAPNALAAAQRLSLGGGRRVVDQSALANPDSNGWRRVTDGNACSFCAMLVSRGNAYRSEKSAGAGRHWHKRCGCSVEEVFGDWTPTAKEQQYVDAYESAVKDLGTEDRVSNQTNVLEKMRAQGGFNDSPKPKIVEPSRESIQIAPNTPSRFDKALRGEEGFLPLYESQTQRVSEMGDELRSMMTRSASEWKTGEWSSINNSLFNGVTSGNLDGRFYYSLDNFLSEADEAFMSLPRTEADILVSRNTSSSFEGIGSMIRGEPGSSYRMDGYTATTAGSASEVRLMGLGGDVEMQIVVPEGSKVMSIDAMRQSGLAGESEILIDRGSNFTLLEKPFQKEGRWIVKLALD